MFNRKLRAEPSLRPDLPLGLTLRGLRTPTSLWGACSEGNSRGPVCGRQNCPTSRPELRPPLSLTGEGELEEPPTSLANSVALGLPLPSQSLHFPLCAMGQ